MFKLSQKQMVGLGLVVFVVAAVAVVVYFYSKESDSTPDSQPQPLPLGIRQTIEEAYGKDLSREEFVQNCMEGAHAKDGRGALMYNTNGEPIMTGGCLNVCNPDYGCDYRECEPNCEANYQKYKANRDIYMRSVRR